MYHVFLYEKGKEMEYYKVQNKELEAFITDKLVNGFEFDRIYWATNDRTTNIRLVKGSPKSY